MFALTFGLLLSDYMSRQVLNAVFPVLKAEWTLTDTQLGSLSSIVALLVGLMDAMQLVPLVALGAVVAFAIGKRHYAEDLKRIQARQH
ncbi:hypothetical protein AZOA_00830 [Azoarcus sp. Aa7]|nr:hypothetical protein [Azoarcus sp. Aa7]